MKGERLPYLYDHYTWPEIREVVRRQPVVIQSIGSVEQHGPHLPLDVDNFLVWEVCEEAARRAPGEILLLPHLPYGYESHHMDFPGTIDILPQHLLDFVLDVTKSVAHHGFRRILLADGHGSNLPILDLVARRTVLETPALCACFIWTHLALATTAELRESRFPGGIAHACEQETSVYLYLNPAAVQMEKAEADLSFPATRFCWIDGQRASPVSLVDYYSRCTRSGVVGEPQLATAEKGRAWFEAAVANLVEFVREFRTLPLRERVDHHG